jgi:hypothetical protein
MPEAATNTFSKRRTSSDPFRQAPPVIFTGLDVHTASTEVRRYGMIGGTHDDVVRKGVRP